MKKADILVIFIVLLLAVGFYALYFSNNQLSGDLMIVVYYKNQVIHEERLEDDTDIIIDFYTEGGKLYLAKGKSGSESLKNHKVVNNIKNVDSRHIENAVWITRERTIMSHANCDDLLCMNMRIGSRTSAPIVCTNGVIIKLVSDEFIIQV